MFVLLLNVIFAILMIFSYCIPNKFLLDNVNSSLATINSEGNYRVVNIGDKGSTLDNHTDGLMIKKAIKENKNPIIESMNISGYPRYWHGYQVFLRPILILGDYTFIRQIYSFILLMLLMIIIFLFFKKEQYLLSFAFLISLISVRFYLFSLSMQFSNIFIVMMLGVIFLLVKDERYFLGNEIYLFFTIIASFSNYFDLLTAPVITLGIPLCLINYMKYSVLGGKYYLGEIFKTISLSILYWGCGYGITWLLKWSIASIVLRKNVIKDALKQILFRTEGSNEYPLNRMQMLIDNLTLAFDRINIAFIIMFVVGLLIVRFFIKRDSKRYKLEEQLSSMFNVATTSFSYIVIAVLPILWYIVLGNHSQIHYYFTYRAQMVLIFSILAFFCSITKVRSSGSSLGRQKNGLTRSKRRSLNK